MRKGVLCAVELTIF